jgi:hypothetical protein
MIQIPNYKSDHKYDYWELKNRHPEWANILDQQNAWSQYEQKPDLASLPPEVVKMIPQTVRDGKTDERIDAWIL